MGDKRRRNLVAKEKTIQDLWSMAGTSIPLDDERMKTSSPGAYVQNRQQDSDNEELRPKETT